MTITRRIRPLLLAAALAAVAASCSLEQEHGYAQSDDGSLSFRYPRAWTDLELQPVSLEWVAGLHGADDGVEAPTSLASDNPLIAARVEQLEPDTRDQVTLVNLRRSVLPSGIDPAIPGTPGVQLLFHNTIVDDNGFEGHHVRFEAELEDGGTARIEHLAVFDRERRRIHSVRASCTPACFDANRAIIDELFDSVRLRP
ncbi:MAG: hypothetical protein AAGD35_14855 [Actinomycetota bacterium]